MSNLRNIAGQKSTTTGAIGVAATIDLDGAAVDSFNTFAAAGCVDGRTYTVTIKDGSNRQVGRATYNTGTPDTLTVVSILASTNSGSAITLTGDADVFIDAAAEDVGGLVLVQQEVITTAVSAVDFDLPAEYSRYKLHFQNIEFSAGAQSVIEMQLSTDGGSTFISTGDHSIFARGPGSYSTSTTFLTTATETFSWFRPIPSITGGTEQNISANLELDVTGDYVCISGFVLWDLTGSYTFQRKAMTARANAFRLYTLSGVTLTSGTFTLYAYKES